MKQKLALLGLSLLLLIVLLTTTDPDHVPSFVLIVPFVLMLSALFTTIWLVLHRRGWSRGKSVRTSLVLAGLPITFLVMQSVGQLTLRDVISIIAIFVIAYFYVSRTMARD